MSEFNTTGPVTAPAKTEEGSKISDVDRQGGRRRRSNGSRKNSWLSHVKATMKVNRGKSFKQVLKLAKKTYKKSQSQSSSQSQSAGRRRRRGKRGGSSMKQSIDDLFQKQQGGSGMPGKAPFGETATPV